MGADGGRSRVREFLVGAEKAKPEMLKLTMINYCDGKFTVEQALRMRTLHPVMKVAFHPELLGGCLQAGEL